MQQPPIPKQQPYPPQQYQQQQQYQPTMPPPKKKSRKRLWLILAAVVLVLAVIIGVASQGQSQKSAPATQSTATSTPVSTTRPKPTATSSTQAVLPLATIKATHGQPILGGNISDFVGKYGESTNIQTGFAPNNDPEVCPWWNIKTDLTQAIEPCYTGQGKVDSITFIYPDSWSLSQLRDYMLTFAPSNSVPNLAYNASDTDLYYDSITIGKFFIHLHGSYMNTV